MNNKTYCFTLAPHKGTGPVHKVDPRRVGSLRGYCGAQKQFRHNLRPADTEVTCRKCITTMKRLEEKNDG